MTKLRTLDLFAGIGGFSLGLERTGGFETVAFCEIEEYPRRVLAKHWPDVPCYRDVRELTAAKLVADGITVDVITGGFPCQDISAAGEGAGLEGERSRLFYEIARLTRELGPRYVILENVSALLGRGLDQVLGTLAEVRYDAEWHCIPASYVGAHHRRDRTWIIAHPNSKRLEGGAQAGDSCEVGPRFQQFIERCANGYGPVWPTEPDVGRVANGIPDRTHRLKALGNAVVPQIPELIARAILEAENDKTQSGI
jgi:DNA (cytosine-5)-methyltransferase 1